MRWGLSIVFVCAVASTPLFAGDKVRATPASSAKLSPQQVLTHWENASAGLLGVGALEHRRVYYLHQNTHSAHEIAILNEFRGPVLAEDLVKRFDWTLKPNKGQWVMIGTPTDEVEKLFFQQLTVVLDSQTHLPSSVQFAGLDNKKPSKTLAVVMSPRWQEPNRFPSDVSAKPIPIASHNPRPIPDVSPVRVVEHVTLRPVPQRHLPVEVQSILTAWETASKQVHSLDATVKRHTFENQNRVEHRAEGGLTFTTPAQVECQLKPAKITASEVSQRLKADGVPFELLPSPGENWKYTPEQIRFAQKPGEQGILLTQNGQVPNTVRQASHQETTNSERVIVPWRMLFQVSATDFAERFDIRLGHAQRGACLVCFPRRGNDVGQFGQMNIYLDPTDWQPYSVELVNRQGDTETVYHMSYNHVLWHVPFIQEPTLVPIPEEAVKLQPAPTTLHGQP